MTISTYGQLYVEKKREREIRWHTGVWLGSLWINGKLNIGWTMISWGRSQLQALSMKWYIILLENIQVYLPVGASVFFLVSDLIYSAGTSLLQLMITKISISWFRKCASGDISASNCYYTTASNADTQGLWPLWNTSNDNSICKQ